MNEKRKKLLNRVPESNDWAAVEKGSVLIKDLAYLSAATKHEFALLSGKKKDVLFHGVERHCNFDDELLELLRRGVYKLVAHTHPDYGKIVVSEDDRRFLKYINQRSSVIISYITGEEVRFSSSYFEDYEGGV